MMTTQVQRRPFALNAAFLKLDKSTHDGLLADSGPPSPALGATDTATSVPADELQDKVADKTSPSGSPTDTVTSLLASTSPPNAITNLVTPDATFICPSWNKSSAPSSPSTHRRHSSQAHTGPAAIANTFEAMRKHRRGLAFAVEKSLSQGDDVACFGKASWESHEGRACEVPFAVWAKIEGGRIGFMQLVGE